MNRWRFALNKRWLGYLVLAVAFAIACVLLSRWQFSRQTETQAEVNKINTNYSAPPQPIGDVLGSTRAYSPADEWMPVRMTGTYLIKDELLVRGRPYGGQPGFEVLTPLRLANGSVFIVDRGWLPTGQSKDSPDVVPAPPKGTVTVVARLQAGEPTLPGRSAPRGQIATINLPTISRQLGGHTYTAAYGLMVSENPAPMQARPAAAVKPDIDSGVNLSYAIQWLAFALFGFFGLGYALRTEYRLRNADDPELRERAAERDRRARAKPLSDNEVEDAIVDALSHR